MFNVLIIGAGVGGLTAAIALRKSGVDAQVFERAPELKELGAGIGLAPNATSILGRLGLKQEIVERGTVLKRILTCTANGRLLSNMRADLTDAPAMCLHRAELQQALLSALPSSCIHLGHEFLRLEMTEDSVTACFANGSRASGNVLIGADGLRSKVRAQLIGDGEPIFRGYQCWRGVCEIPASEELTETFGPGLRIGVVPVGRRGTAWWCTANEAEGVKEGPDAGHAKLLDWFGDWHRPIPEVIRATPSTAIIKTGIYDRRPVKKWSQGFCTLLGDAAHPMTPNLGQGGCMAIEDAAMLTRCLTHYSHRAEALRIYERLRYPRTSMVTRISRYWGVLGRWKNPGAVWLRDTLLSSGPEQASTRSYLRFVRYDPEQVPLKESEGEPHSGALV